jgi:hypothetical protein
VDILVVNNQDLAPIGGDIARSPGTPQLFRNDSVNDNAWLGVELQGVGAGQHPHGIGARVEVHGEFGLRVREIHASSGYLGGDQGRLAHFGLGEDPGALEVRVRWPAGDWSFVPATAGQELAISGLHSLVSTREALVGELVQANGAALPPLGAARRWVVEGQAHADPLSLSFATAGTRQLRLDVLAPDGVTVVRSEVREVRVAHGRGEAGLVFQ